MKITVDQAFEGNESGDPIIITRTDVEKICREHNANPADFYNDQTLNLVTTDWRTGACDAATLFAWLGY